MPWWTKSSRRPGQASLPVIGAALLAIAAIAIFPRVYDAGFPLAHDDPADVADHLLDRSLTTAVAEREIAAALDGNDVDLANSFAELARDRGLVIDPGLARRVAAENSTVATATRHATSFARGLITGEPDDAVGLAGTALGDVFVFGDVRDAAREGVRLARGEAADELVLGLACIGIAVTAGTYASLGLATPARVGLSLTKVARKTGGMSARLAGAVGRSLHEAVDTGALRRVLATASVTEPAVALRAARDVVKLDKARGLVNMVGDVGRIEARAGTRAALDGLRLSEGPRDVARVAKLAEKQRGKTRAILKLLGRAVLAVGFLSFEAASWLLTAVMIALGFCAAVKGMTERATLRIVHNAKRRRERRRLREAKAALLQCRLATPLSAV
jgi:hypothetical protein